MLSCLIVAIGHAAPVSAAEGWVSRVEGDRLIYTPETLSAGQFLELTVLPAQPPDEREFSEWFVKTLLAEQKVLGKPLHLDLADWNIRVDGNGRLRADNAIHDPDSGATRGLNYRGADLGGGRYLLSYLLSNAAAASDEGLVARLPGVMAEAEALRVAEADQAAELRERNAERAAEQAALEEKLAREERAKALRTAPGEGVQREQIETFWVNAVLDVFFGGLDVSISALLTDGTIYRGVGIPISELDVVASKRLEPGKWSTWRKSGSGGYAYSWQNDDKGTSGWSTLEGWRAELADADEVVDGLFEYSGGSQYSGSFTYGLRLTADKRFERSSFSLRSTPDSISPDITPTITSATTRDGDGTDVVTSVTSGPVVGGAQRSTGNSDGSGNRGSYRIDGDVIERVYDDGETSRQLFLWARDDKSSMIVGDTFYYLP